MSFLRRPWGSPARGPFGPSDMLLSIGQPARRREPEHTRLLDWRVNDQPHELKLHPYPKLGHSQRPVPVEGLPYRPKSGVEPKTEEERRAADALGRMNRVVARLQELEASLDDPENVWDRLADAWRRAENDQDPRLAEIVRQARDLRPRLQELEGRIRRVLRRTRELTPLDRAQEMDRASMLWLARQPGRSTVERAGADQRVLAIVRHENFDTVENRVLHAYVALAADVAREWLREHRGARTSERYRRVEDYRRYCRHLARTFRESGIGRAAPGITPNYVLTDDRAYREIFKGWLRLLKREHEIDDLWRWQAESWSDFCTLAITLSIHALDEARLVTQSPILWRGEAVAGRWFVQDNPLAVFWLRNTRRIVEVRARPGAISSRQAEVGAWLWLRVSDLDEGGRPRRLPVWTLHCFDPHDVASEARGAADCLQRVQRIPAQATMKQGLVLMQAFGEPRTEQAAVGACSATAISLDASGASLARGMRELGAYIQSLVLEGT